MDHHIIDNSDEVIYPAMTTQKSKKNKFLLGAASLLLAVGTLVIINLSNTQTQGVGTYRNYSADAIIQGGAITEKELLSKYDQNASGIQSIFKHYNISRSDLTGQTSEIKHGVVYQDGRVVTSDDGKTVATGAYSVSRLPFNDAYGNAPRKVSIADTTFYEGPNMNIFVRPVDAFIFFRNGQFHRAVISSCANPVVATPTPPEPKPVYSCNSLNAERRERTRFRYTATATAHSGATIDSYLFDFGDGKTEKSKSASIEHAYATTPKTYTATVTVYVNVGGKIVAAPATNNCTTTATVTEEPKAAVYKCERLTPQLIQGKDRTFSFTLDHIAEGGAKLKSVIYNFGDGNSKTIQLPTPTTVEHQFAKPGTYTTTATLHFSVPENGKVVEKSIHCETSVTVAKPENCPLPGKEDLPKNSPECTEPLIETPPELPQTGLAEWLAGGAGLAALAAALYYWNLSRKNLEKTMLKK